VSLSAITRPTRSKPPPGGCGTITLIGWLGKSCASQKGETDRNNTQAASRRRMTRTFNWKHEARIVDRPENPRAAALFASRTLLQQQLAVDRRQSHLVFGCRRSCGRT